MRRKSHCQAPCGRDEPAREAKARAAALKAPASEKGCTICTRASLLGWASSSKKNTCKAQRRARYALKKLYSRVREEPHAKWNAHTDPVAASTACSAKRRKSVLYSKRRTSQEAGIAILSSKHLFYACIPSNR